MRLAVKVTDAVELAEKKLASSLSRAERLALFDRDSGELTVVVQYALLSLHRSAVYYQAQPVTARELFIQRRIDEIYTAMPFYDIRKLTAQLRQDWLAGQP